MPFEYAPASGPPARPRSLTALPPALAALPPALAALPPALAALTAELRAAVGTGHLAPRAATAAVEQLAKAARQAQAPAPDTVSLAVHLVAARAILLEADASPALPRALTDALALVHQLRAAPRSPTS